jgi:hypothetical protein
MASKTESYWQNSTGNEEDDLSPPPSRLRTILSRAVQVYLILFLSISALLSILGVDPLTHDGLIPECLLVCIGFSVLFSLANGEDETLINEQARSRLALFSHWPQRREKATHKTGDLN